MACSYGRRQRNGKCPSRKQARRGRGGGGARRKQHAQRRTTQHHTITRFRVGPPMVRIGSSDVFWASSPKVPYTLIRASASYNMDGPWFISYHPVGTTAPFYGSGMSRNHRVTREPQIVIWAALGPASFNREYRGVPGLARDSRALSWVLNDIRNGKTWQLLSSDDYAQFADFPPSVVRDALRKLGLAVP